MFNGGRLYEALQWSFKEVEDDSNYYDIGYDWMKDSKNGLREAIAGWYYNLVNFAIVALLSVLVYVGIRMITSTISQDKAKYKTMFKDWLVAICLLIFMHYIMIGVLNLTSMITDALGTEGGRWKPNCAYNVFNI